MALSNQFFREFHKYLKRPVSGLSFFESTKLKALEVTIASYDVMTPCDIKLAAAVDWAYSVLACFSETEEGVLVEGFLTEERMILVKKHFTSIELKNMHRMAKRLVDLNSTQIKKKCT